jgi:hypothetical protein
VGMSIKVKDLAPGGYRLVMMAVDAAGTTPRIASVILTLQNEAVRRYVAHL